MSDHTDKILHLCMILVLEQMKTNTQIKKLMICLFCLLPACNPINIAITESTGLNETAVSNTPTTVMTSRLITPTETIESTASTVTITATLTPISTPASVPTLSLDELTQDLPSSNYELLHSATFTNSEKSRLMAYILKDRSLEPFSISGKTGAEICRIVFYQWKNGENMAVATFSAPTYRQTESVFPVICEPINWDNPLYPWWEPSQTEIENLHLRGFGSDINENGLPEFAIYYNYCRHACWDDGIVAVHFYEFQDDETVKNITVDLPGTITPTGLTYHNIPRTIQVYDQGFIEPSRWANSYWIFAWNGMLYEEVTRLYANDFLAWGESRLDSIRQQYGEPITSVRNRFP